MYVFAPAVIIVYGLLSVCNLPTVHASRDQILLDGEDAQSDDEGEEEEVFALKGIPDDSSLHAPVLVHQH